MQGDSLLVELGVLFFASCRLWSGLGACPSTRFELAPPIKHPVAKDTAQSLLSRRQFS